MRSARPARADGAGRVAPADPRDPPAAGNTARLAAGGGAFPRGAAWPVAISLAWVLLALRSSDVT